MRALLKSLAPTTLRALLASCVMCSAAQAALVVPEPNPSTSVAFDNKVGIAAVIYDANYYGSEGRLLFVTQGGTLAGPGVSTSPIPSQSYFTTGDSVFDSVLSLRINPITGAIVIGSDSVVSVPRDANLTSPTGGDFWSFSGSVTAFGFDLATGSFDGRWSTAAYNFNLPTGPSVPATCSGGNCGTGIFKINGGLSGAPLSFASDFVLGAGGLVSGSTYATTISQYTTGIATSAFRSTSLTSNIIFAPVPEPATLASLAVGGLIVGGAVLRRRRRA